MKDALRNLFRNGERSKLQKARKKEDASPVTEKRSRDNRSPPSGTNGTSMLASSPILHDGYAIPTAGIAMLDGDGECQWRNFSGIADGKATSQYSEESHESVLDLGRPNYDFPPLDNEKNGFSAPPDVEDDDPYSHAAMSIRAEQILANAKKRLTVSLSIILCVQLSALTSPEHGGQPQSRQKHASPQTIIVHVVFQKPQS